MLINPTPADNSVSCQVKISEIPFSRVHVYEYLGVHIDDKLSVSNQIDNICKKVSQKHNILKKIRKYELKRLHFCLQNNNTPTFRLWGLYDRFGYTNQN